MTPSVLRTTFADGNPPLWHAVEHIIVIMLVISRHPPALVAVVGGLRIWQKFQSLPAENRCSNHDEIVR